MYFLLLIYRKKQSLLWENEETITQSSKKMRQGLPRLQSHRFVPGPHQKVRHQHVQKNLQRASRADWFPEIQVKTADEQSFKCHQEVFQPRCHQSD